MANQVVTEYAEGHMKLASRKIDSAVRHRKGMDPNDAKHIVYEYNEWLDFVNPKRRDDSFYLVRVKNHKARVIPSDE